MLIIGELLGVLAIVYIAYRLYKYEQGEHK